MRKNLLLLTCCLIIFPLQFAAKPSIPPPPIHVEDGWDKNEDGDRSFSSSPSLFKDANFVYTISVFTKEAIMLSESFKNTKTYLT